MFREKILANVVGRVPGQLAAGFHQAISRRKFGAAPFARAKSGDLGRSGVAKKLAAFTQGRFHPANGTAVDARGLDRHKEASIKTSVTRQDSLIALIRIQVHDHTINRKRKERSPFSDMKFGYFSSRTVRRIFSNVAGV